MIAVRRVGCPIGVSVVRCKEFYAPAVFRDAVEFGNKSHHVGNVFGNVIRDDLVKLVVGKRIRNIAKVVNHVSRRARIVVYADGARMFVVAAADIEDFHKTDVRCQMLVFADI